MTDIMKYNVRTYVEELIKNEFSSKNNEKALSDKRKTNTGEHLNVQQRSILKSSVMEERFQTWENKHEC